MSRTKTITYKGEDIFYMDFSNAKDRQEVSDVMKDSIAYIRNQPLGSVMALTNMENIFFNMDIKDDFQHFIKDNKPYIKTSSLFGLSGLARILFNGLMKITGRDIRSYETMIDAQEFLLKRN
ncbi:MAG: hypothetical protein DRJ10_16385 [Bacteroidetes bacterium]|nr:MAG: hypothetical protein DRJ10_16385 [Bacteroidota bacterium]